MSDTNLCNVAWPCGRIASWSVKVFDTLPRFACTEHKDDVTKKGAETRSISLGPWIAPHVEVDGSGKVVTRG